MTSFSQTIHQYASFATEVLTNSSEARREGIQVIHRISHYLEVCGVILSSAESNALADHIKKLISVGKILPQPASITVGTLREAARKLRLPPNTLILYQRLDDRYFDILGWDQHRFVWDAQYETDYYAPTGYHIAANQAGHVAFCLHATTEAVDLQAHTTFPRLPGISRHGAQDRPSDLQTALIERMRAKLGNTHASQEDYLAVVGNVEEAAILALHHNQALVAGWHPSSTPAIGSLLEDLAGLPADTPVYCQRERDTKASDAHVLQRGSTSDNYWDTFDWQFPKGADGFPVACLNTWM
jgi:hypothetical protein